MKYLFILGLFAFVALLVYWRMRPYIHTARRAMKAFRKMQVDAAAQNTVKPSAARVITDGQLTKCARCGTWVVEARALRPGGASTPFYCSRLHRG
ncbi:MAG: hypothetical protein WKF84_12180 [Pyrinomonadaceae bacterium]